MSATDVVLRPAAAPPAVPPAVARALDRVEAVLPVEAARARALLAQVLGPVARSAWPELGDRFSLLTNTGLPVELAWSSRDAVLRWTCEVAPPETPHHDRVALAGRAGGVDVRQWLASQAGRDLSYGAWLGMRHRGGDSVGKVYLELPDGCPLPPPWDRSVAALPALVPGLEWRMAGVNRDGSVELYARAPVDEDDLDVVEGRSTGTRGLLRTAVRELLPAPGLPRPSALSIALDPSGAPRAVTWFCVAKAVWRDDATAAAALAAWPAHPLSRAVYAALAAGPPDGRWRHTMAGVTVDATGATSVQTGVRP